MKAQVVGFCYTCNFLPVAAPALHPRALGGDPDRAGQAAGSKSRQPFPEWRAHRTKWKPRSRASRQTDRPGLLDADTHVRP